MEQIIFYSLFFISGFLLCLIFNKNKSNIAFKKGDLSVELSSKADKDVIKDLISKRFDICLESIIKRDSITGFDEDNKQCLNHSDIITNSLFELKEGIYDIISK